MLHLKKVGAKLTTLSDKQAEYIGVKNKAPLKRILIDINKCKKSI